MSHPASRLVLPGALLLAILLLLAAPTRLERTSGAASSRSSVQPGTHQGSAPENPCASATQQGAAESLPTFGPQTSLLVVSPHPDDESLCCAGVMQRVLHAGGKVSVVWITSGDGSELDQLVIERSLFANPLKMRDLGKRRMREARAAANSLGVPADRQLFLGYPDRGVLALLTDNYLTPYRSSFTDIARVPYADALFPGHPYTGEALESDFEAVLNRIRPTWILAPSPKDAHPDHRASGILVMRIAARRHEVGSVWYWIVHGGGAWPVPRGLDETLDTSIAPRAQGMTPVVFRLESAEEQAKLLAVQGYHTQMEVMASLLLAFVRRTELFYRQPLPLDADQSD